MGGSVCASRNADPSSSWTRADSGSFIRIRWENINDLRRGSRRRLFHCKEAMNFPNIATAEDYLKNTLQDFYNQRGVLTNRLTQIARLKDEAIKRDDQQTIGQLIVMRSGVLNLLQEQYDLETKLEPFRSYFGVRQWHPLGALPLILAGGAVVLASSLYLYYEKLKNQAKALDMIAKGMLPASQAEAILNPSFLSGVGGSFAQVGIVAGVGLLAFMYFMRKS
jgi:hypothetical protein